MAFGSLGTGVRPKRHKAKGNRTQRKTTHPIDNEHLAAHVLACSTRQEDNRAREVARFAPPSRGDALRNLAQPDRVLE